MSTPDDKLPAANGDRADSHNAAVRMSFIGCTAWIQDDRTRRRENRRGRAGHAAGKLPADRECRRARATNAAIGVSQKIASWPKTAASGAISTDMPGAQIGDAASACSGDGMNPPGASVAGRSGHGASASALCGCRCRFANALAIKRIAGGIRSAHRPRAAHDAERRQRDRHDQGAMRREPRPAARPPWRRRFILKSGI